MNSIKILSIHSIVSEAMKALPADAFDYNYPLAEREARRIDALYGQSFVCDDGKIRYTYMAPDGLRSLNVFEPFSSCVDNTPFRLVKIDYEKMEIRMTDPVLEKHLRAVAIEQNWLVA